MILFAVGLPGRFAQWCDAALSGLAGLSGGEVVSRTWPPLGDLFRYGSLSPTLNELARVLIGGRAAHVVIGLRQPDDRLRRALAERGTRFVVALDDPRNAVVDTLRETGAEPKTVIRAIANCCPLVMNYNRLPGALTLHAEQARNDPRGAIAELAAHFEIAAPPGAIDALAGEMTALDACGPPPSGADAVMPPAPALDKMLEGALRPYHDVFRGGTLEEIVWTRDLFALGSDPVRAPTEPVAIAGSPHMLIFGPYIHLPAGSWSAQIVLGFSEEAAGHGFLIDVFAGAPLAATTLRPETAGVYCANLSFSLGEPSGNGVEVRVMAAGDNARGELAFGQVVLRSVTTRQADPASPEDAAFTRVLAL